MPTERIKGQEVSVIFTNAGNLETEFSDIRSLEMTADFEIKSEGYIGEKTNRKDMIFNGAKGSLEMHIHSGDQFRVLQAIKDKAQRKTPDVEFNIAGVFSFPSGEVQTGTIPNVAFGPVPVSVSARGDYVTMKLEFESSDINYEQE